MAFGDAVLSAGYGCGAADAQLMRDTVKEHSRLGRRRLGEGASRVWAFRTRGLPSSSGRSQLHSADLPPLLRAKLNWSNLHAGRVCSLTPRRSCRGGKINGWLHTSAFPFSNFEESVLDRDTPIFAPQRLTVSKRIGPPPRRRVCQNAAIRKRPVRARIGPPCQKRPA